MIGLSADLAVYRVEYMRLPEQYRPNPQSLARMIQSCIALVFEKAMVEKSLIMVVENYTCRNNLLIMAESI